MNGSAFYGETASLYNAGPSKIEDLSRLIWLQKFRLLCNQRFLGAARQKISARATKLIHRIARLARSACCSDRKIFTALRRRIQDCARRINHHPTAIGSLAGLDRRLDVATLRANARHQQGHITDDGAYLCELSGKGRADHQTTLSMSVPLRGD